MLLTVLDFLLRITNIHKHLLPSECNGLFEVITGFFLSVYLLLCKVCMWGKLVQKIGAMYKKTMKYQVNVSSTTA